MGHNTTVLLSVTYEYSIYLLCVPRGEFGLSGNTALSPGMWGISSLCFPEKYEREAEIWSGTLNCCH